MTLIVAVTNREGIVIAGDSRQTYYSFGGTDATTVLAGSDSGAKIFELKSGSFAAISGWAFLRPQGAAASRDISSLIDEFRPTIQSEASIATMAADLHRYLVGIYQWHVGQNYNPAPPDGQPALSVLVGGYDPYSRSGSIMQCDIPGPVHQVRDTEHPLPYWLGQTDVVARIMLGYDPRLPRLLQAAPETPRQFDVQRHLAGLNYTVDWPSMTLQDAIDFARSMIEITITIHGFADGDWGVGGPIDIGLCRPGEPFTWIARKKLHN